LICKLSLVEDWPDEQLLSDIIIQCDITADNISQHQPCQLLIYLLYNYQQILLVFYQLQLQLFLLQILMLFDIILIFIDLEFIFISLVPKQIFLIDT